MANLRRQYIQVTHDMGVNIIPSELDITFVNVTFEHGLDFINQMKLSKLPDFPLANLVYISELTDEGFNIVEMIG